MRKINIAVMAITALFIVASLVGCKKTPAYVGTYGIEMTAEQKQKLSDAEAKVNAMPKGSPQRVMGEEMLKKQKEELAKSTLVLKEDGTYTATGFGQDTKGTYTFKDNSIVFTESPASGSKAPRESMTMPFDEKAKTLTMPVGKDKVVFKMK